MDIKPPVTKGSTDEAAPYTDPQDRFWALYLKHAKVADAQRLERWKEDTGGILVFMGLFSVIVTTFIVETYESLRADQDASILVQPATLISLNRRGTSAPPGSPDRAAVPTASTTSFGALWFLSLCVSVISSLLAIMVQQWARQYNHSIQRDVAPSTRGPKHLILSQAIESFQVDRGLELIVTLVHIAVLLFFVGLIIFLSTINTTITALAAVATGLGVVIYIVLSILPLLYPGCPYNTPLTPACRPVLYCLLSLNHLWSAVITTLGRFGSTLRGFGRALETIYIRKEAALPLLIFVALVDAVAILGQWFFRVIIMLYTPVANIRLIWDTVKILDVGALVTAVISIAAILKALFSLLRQYLAEIRRYLLLGKSRLEHERHRLNDWLNGHRETLQKEHKSPLNNNMESKPPSLEIWLGAINSLFERTTDVRGMTEFFDALAPLVFTSVAMNVSDLPDDLREPDEIRRVLPIDLAQDITSQILEQNVIVMRANAFIESCILNQLSDLEADCSQGLAATCLFIRNLMITAHSVDRKSAISSYEPIYRTLIAYSTHLTSDDGKATLTAFVLTSSKKREIILLDSTELLLFCIRQSLRCLDIPEMAEAFHGNVLGKCVICRLADTIEFIVTWWKERPEPQRLSALSRSTRPRLSLLQALHAEARIALEVRFQPKWSPSTLHLLDKLHTYGEKSVKEICNAGCPGFNSFENNIQACMAEVLDLRENEELENRWNKAPKRSERFIPWQIQDDVSGLFRSFPQVRDAFADLLNASGLAAELTGEKNAQKRRALYQKLQELVSSDEDTDTERDAGIEAGTGADADAAGHAAADANANTDADAAANIDADTDVNALAVVKTDADAARNASPDVDANADGDTAAIANTGANVDVNADADVKADMDATGKAGDDVDTDSDASVRVNEVVDAGAGAGAKAAGDAGADAGIEPTLEVSKPESSS